MDRLTSKYRGGYGLVKVKNDEQEIESPYPNTLRACFESWQRLGAYEDTGLMPDEIAAMQAELAAMQPDRQIKGVCADCLWCTESDKTNRIFCVVNGDGSEFETFPGEWCSNFTRRPTDEECAKVWEESEWEESE